MAAGPARLYHVLASKPRSPDSATVGISGALALRLTLVTAMARSRPDRIGGSAGSAFAIVIEALPAIVSAIAGTVPLYGMCRRLMPVWILSSSAVRCALLPVPGDANESWRVRARAISSFSDFAG